MLGPAADEVKARRRLNRCRDVVQFPERCEMKFLARLIILAVSLTPAVFALNVKVEKVDTKKGKVRLLLPMHSMMLEVSVYPRGESVRVKTRQFYWGSFVRQKTSQPHPNILQIRIPDEKPARFRVHRILFLEK